MRINQFEHLDASNWKRTKLPDAQAYGAFTERPRVMLHRGFRRAWNWDDDVYALKSVGTSLYAEWRTRDVP